MQLFISRGRTVAIYPGYRVELKKVTKEIYTGRLRAVGQWIFEIDFLYGKPVCAIAVDPAGNFYYGDDALLNFKKIYDKEKDNYVFEIIDLSEKEVLLDKEYAPQSIIEHPELLFQNKTIGELEEAIIEHTLKWYRPQERIVKNIRKIRFAELDIIELAQLLSRAKYAGKIKSSIREIVERYKGTIYLSCMENNTNIRIVINDEIVKTTAPIDLDKELQCKMFVIVEKDSIDK